uniref:CW-type domain-containing protein n=1 Tax=Panagrellus redivivus TaxID=6233 RepID=A0A7E4V2N7_PANRE
MVETDPARPERNMSSPRKYAVSRRSAEYYADGNGELRRSKRQAAAAGIDFAEIAVKKVKLEDTEAVEQKTEQFDTEPEKRAVIAEWQQPMNPCEDRDRDEFLFAPAQTWAADDIEVQKYLTAAHDKLGTDTHVNMIHLDKHKCDFKEALETIDAVDSLPMVSVNSRDGTGIWSPIELQTLATRWSCKNKNLPHKPATNITNAILRIKTLRLMPVKHKKGKWHFSEKEVYRAQKELGNRSANCANCRDKLWMKSPEEYPEVLSLCMLCDLYQNTFRRMRPNAAVTPEVFQFGELTPCEKCKFSKGLKKIVRDTKAAVTKKVFKFRQPIARKCNGARGVMKTLVVKNNNNDELPRLQSASGSEVRASSKVLPTVTTKVFNIKPLAPIEYNFALQEHNKECVDALRKCLNKDILSINGANIQDLFQGLVGMNMSSAVKDLITSVDTDDTYVFVCRKGVEKLSGFPRFDLGVPSAAGSDENADPSEAYKFEVLQICWDMHAYSMNNLSFTALQWWTKREKIDLKEAWRKDFEAGKAGGLEPDCMLYGTITANGRIMPGTDATFAEYFDRITA